MSSSRNQSSMNSSYSAAAAGSQYQSAMPHRKPQQPPHRASNAGQKMNQNKYHSSQNSSNEQYSAKSASNANANTSNTSKDSSFHSSRRYSLEKHIKNNEGVYRNARYVNISLILVGCPVTLKVKSGDVFHGILTAFSPDFEVVLECCHQVGGKNEVIIYGKSFPNKADVQTMIFSRQDIVELTASDVDKEYAIKTAESSFLDSSIAQKVNGVKESPDCKELEPFAFDEEADEASNEQNSLEDELAVASGTGSGAVAKEAPVELDLETNKNGWSADEMLNINQKKYGYVSTYNSDLTDYTLPVERQDTEEYRRREEEAEKIAREIESSTTYKNNVDKELSDNEEEEAAFSAVDRSAEHANANARNSTEINNNNKEYSSHQYSSKPKYNRGEPNPNAKTRSMNERMNKPGSNAPNQSRYNNNYNNAANSQSNPPYGNKSQQSRFNNQQQQQQQFQQSKSFEMRQSNSNNSSISSQTPYNRKLAEAAQLKRMQSNPSSNQNPPNQSQAPQSQPSPQQTSTPPAKVTYSSIAAGTVHTTTHTSEPSAANTSSAPSATTSVSYSKAASLNLNKKPESEPKPVTRQLSDPKLKSATQAQPKAQSPPAPAAAPTPAPSNPQTPIKDTASPTEADQSTPTTQPPETASTPAVSGTEANESTPTPSLTPVPTPEPSQPKSKLNPFAQEFNPLRMSVTSPPPAQATPQPVPVPVMAPMPVPVPPVAPYIAINPQQNTPVPPNGTHHPQAQIFISTHNYQSNGQPIYFVSNGNPQAPPYYPPPQPAPTPQSSAPTPQNSSKNQPIKKAVVSVNEPSPAGQPAPSKQAQGSQAPPNYAMPPYHPPHQQYRMYAPPGPSPQNTPQFMGYDPNTQQPMYYNQPQPVIYNPMGQVYAPTSSTPSSMVGPSAPHTPSPMSQQQGGQQGQTNSGQSQSSQQSSGPQPSSSNSSMNLQMNGQQGAAPQPAPPQQAAFHPQALYFLPSPGQQQQMPPGAPYFIPYGGQPHAPMGQAGAQPPHQQHYMYVPNQQQAAQVNPYQAPQSAPHGQQQPPQAGKPNAPMNYMPNYYMQPNPHAYSH